MKEGREEARQQRRPAKDAALGTRGPLPASASESLARDGGARVSFPCSTTRVPRLIPLLLFARTSDRLLLLGIMAGDRESEGERRRRLGS